MSVLNNAEIAGDHTAGEHITGSAQAEEEEGLIAEVLLKHARLPLQPTLSNCPDLRISPDYQTMLDGTKLLFFTLHGETEQFDTFEREVTHDPTVTDVQLVDICPGRRVYRAALTAEAVQYRPLTAKAGGRMTSQTGLRSGWVVELRLPNREALRIFNDQCADEDITVRVRALCHAKEDEEQLAGLTDKQRQFLEIAYEEGYFDEPRRISQEGIAEKLGVSKSAISQRSRRALKALCRETFPTFEASDPAEYNGR